MARRTHFALALALGLSTGLRAGTAAADDRARVGVVPVAVSGQMTAQWTPRLQAAVVRGLSKGGLAVVEIGDATCTTPRCLTQIARDEQVAFVVAANIVAHEQDYTFELRIHQPKAGPGAFTVQERCELCGIGEVTVLVEAQAARLAFRMLSTEAPQIVIRSNPAGAEVRVDGALVGTTPTTLTIAPGQHDVAVTRAGYATKIRRIFAAPGTQDRFDAELVPLRARRSRSQRFTIAGWSTLAPGVAAVAAGATLVAIDSRPVQRSCTGANLDRHGHCRYLHDTLGGGIAAVSVGATAIITGGVFLLLSRRAMRSRRSAGSRYPAARRIVRW